MNPRKWSYGSIWWTGMFANVIGRVDPRTNEIKEYPLKTPGSGPHGLELDKGGHVWFHPVRMAWVGSTRTVQRPAN